MIKAIIFDLDNTLIDFMTMKKMSVEGAIRSMQDAGLDISNNKAQKILYALYDKHGMEYQKVFQDFLKQVMRQKLLMLRSTLHQVLVSIIKMAQ